MDKNKIAKSVYEKDMTEAYSEHDIHEAIKQLRPGCTFDVSLAGGEYYYHSFWHPENLEPPTKEEVQSQLKYQEECREYYEYAYNRCREYPDGFEQLDMLWNAVNQGIDLKESEWFKSILEVKHKYPKPDRDPPKREY